MSLTRRLMLFFVGAIAMVLIGFSMALYALARHHLHSQVEERVQAALSTLVAVAEVSADGVEWETADRQLTLWPGSHGGALVWAVLAPDGKYVDRAAAREFASILDDGVAGSKSDASWFEPKEARWLFGQRLLKPGPESPTVSPPDAGAHRYPSLRCVVGTSLVPVDGTLRMLAATLSGLSLVLLLSALAVGQAVCRRALQPVTAMACTAREMDASTLGERLPVSTGGDEVEDLSCSFNSLLDRVEESFERQRRFTGDAGHQLRTPLTAMLGQIDVALRRDRSPDGYRETLAALREQTVRLGKIVEALLFLARSDADAEASGTEPVPLADWLREHLDQRQNHHDPAAVLHVDVVGDVVVRVQPILLGELVDLLLDNACKHGTPGQPIRLTLAKAGDSVELSVADHGPGIQLEDLPHLFRPFFRSGDARRRGIEGLGLGLAIARRLADALGGDISVTSRLGEGSCFTLRLPVVLPS